MEIGQIKGQLDEMVVDQKINFTESRQECHMEL